MRATYAHNVVSGISFFSHGVIEEWYLWNDIAIAKQHVLELKRHRLAHAEKNAFSVHHHGRSLVSAAVFHG